MESGGDKNCKWKPKHGERPALRRPRDTEQSNSSNPKRSSSPDVYVESEEPDSSGNLSPSPDKPSLSGNSTLSPFAKEFVPRNHQSVLSPYAKEFTPSGIANEYSSTENEEFFYDCDTFTDMIHQLIYEVSVDPASFETEARNLTAILMNGPAVNTQVLECIAEIIVSQGIQLPNFRYNAVRLCTHLSERLQQHNMRNIVLKQCQDVFNRSDEYMLTPEGQGNFRGYVLFLGEIYSQMEVGGKKLSFIGEKLYSILEKLLGDPTSDNLKSVCQVVKFVGMHLEDQERDSNEQREAPTMDRIFSRIEECSLTIGSTLERCIAGMLNSVVELRKSNFGRGDVSPAISTNSHASDTNTTDPVRYGPDGQQLTAEEALFVDSMYNDVPNGDEFGYEDNGESEEMDDEMCKAFEEFLHNMPR